MPRLWRLCLLLILLALPVMAHAPAAGAQAPISAATACASAGNMPFLSLGSPFATPAAGRVDHTTLYGSTNRFGLLHTGFDMPAKLSTPVFAVGAGRVLLAGPDTAVLYSPRANFYGKMVVLELPVEGGALHVIYGHLDRVLVAQGQQVKAGDRIGLVGMTGVAIGPHLHLEVRYPSAKLADARNPALWLRPLPGTGSLAGRLTGADGRPVQADRLLVYRLTPKQTLYRVIKSYQDGMGVQQDPTWQENFTLPDVPAGKYRIVAGRGSTIRQVDVVIQPGGLAFVELQLGAAAPKAQVAPPCYWVPATAQLGRK